MEQPFKWNWKKAYYCSISLNAKSKKWYLNLKKNWASFKDKQRMKQQLITKVLGNKAWRISASSCQQQILYYMSVIPPCKRSYIKEVILNLNVLYVYSKSFIVVTVYFWLAKYIFTWYDIWYDMIYDNAFIVSVTYVIKALKQWSKKWNTISQFSSYNVNSK